jgi:hypothetical protein
MSSLLVYDLYGYFTWFHLTKLIHVISMNKQLCGQEHFHNWYACIQLEITLKLPEGCHLIGNTLLIENSQIIDIYLIL